ncbi:hypothetical protein JHV675_51620 [Mycobacterium avium subsp. hominissuis]
MFGTFPCNGPARRGRVQQCLDPIARRKPRMTRSGARRAIGSRHCWTRPRRAGPLHGQQAGHQVVCDEAVQDVGDRRVVADDLVASLLLVHGLHPHDVVVG